MDPKLESGSYYDSLQVTDSKCVEGEGEEEVPS